MESELEKNPRGAAQAVMQLQQQQQDDMRRLQMERFRRLLVNFDDDVADTHVDEDDAEDGEVQVSSASKIIAPVQYSVTIVPFAAIKTPYALAQADPSPYVAESRDSADSQSQEVTPRLMCICAWSYGRYRCCC
jgi:hypothetical protein